MKVLVSWSGKQSQAVAKALHEWLPGVVPNATPWMSTLDISPGSRWFDELMTQLERTDSCVICLTPDNVRSPWLYFEAGAIAAKRKQVIVCGFLTGISISRLGPGPFAQFQCVESDSDGTWQLVRALNAALGEAAHNENLLRVSFDSHWPRLRERLKEALLHYDPHAGPPEESLDAPRPKYGLPKESSELLLQAAADPDGSILMTRTMHGFVLQTNNRQMCEGADARTVARWQAAVRNLLEHGLLNARGSKGEVFGVTAEGYRVADELSGAHAPDDE